MKRRFTGLLLAKAAAVCAATGLLAGAMAGIAEPHNVIEAARKTVEDFEGNPHRTQFRATIRRANAVVILPASPSTGDGSSRKGRPAVAVVHDGGRGSWSRPAFFRVSASGDDATAGDADVIFLVMKTGAVGQLKEGSMELGGSDGVDVTSVTTGVEPGIEINATADILAFVDVDQGEIGPSFFDHWRLTADPALNKGYYDEASTPESILSQGTVRTPGVEKLIGGLRIAEGIDDRTPP